MFIVALTGGIGSGKSQVAKYFHQLGSYVFDADQLARSAIEPGTAGYEKVRQNFPSAISQDGVIDRRKLGEIIFADKNAKLNLENIIHPEVQRLFHEALELIPKNSIVIYEIPLLAESNSRDRFDFAISVEAEVATRTERLIARGMANHEIVGRMAAQVNRDERVSHCDLVIENHGSSEELRGKVEEIWQQILIPLNESRQ
jgi:dephospho-CoA kinase